MLTPFTDIYVALGGDELIVYAGLVAWSPRLGMPSLLNGRFCNISPFSRESSSIFLGLLKIFKGRTWGASQEMYRLKALLSCPQGWVTQINFAHFDANWMQHCATGMHKLWLSLRFHYYHFHSRICPQSWHLWNCDVKHILGLSFE